MWKYILYYCLFIAICFMIPSFFVDFSKVNNEQISVENKENIREDISRESGDTMKLLLSESNQIIELTMNDYIKGVVLR